MHSRVDIEGHEKGSGAISYQVVQECLNAVTAKARLALAPDEFKACCAIR